MVSVVLSDRLSDCEVVARSFRSPLRYPGGKQKALSQIALKLPLRAKEYREPMVGGASVFLHARSVGLAKKYWINDRFAELISFWQILQDRKVCAQLMEELERLRASFADAEEIKEFFHQARRQKTPSKYRQALLFFFFNRVTFSGTTRAGGFSSSAALKRFTASSIDRLKTMPVALKDVRITKIDFEKLITQEGDEVFIFLDPPYFTAQRLYGRNGSLHDFDHEKMAHLLKRSEHRFLITYDDCPEIRRLYKWANIDRFQLQYGMNNCNMDRLSKIGCELFISNY